MGNKFVRVERGVYRYHGADKSSRVFFERVYVGGRDTYHRLTANTLEQARRERLKNQEQYALWSQGQPEVKNPYDLSWQPKVDAADLGYLFAEYEKVNCPDAAGFGRIGDALKGEKRNLKRLREWKGWAGLGHRIDQLNQAILDRYAEYRRQSPKSRVRNGRRIDMEIVTLRNMLRWAARKELIKANPLAMVEVARFCSSGQVTHHKQTAPETGLEVHTIAAKFFAVRPSRFEDRQVFECARSVVLGFQMLFEAFTGVRTSEALRCRWNAKYGEAGFIDGSFLHLDRCKKGVNPWARIHPALRELLAMMSRWRLAPLPEYLLVFSVGEKPGENRPVYGAGPWLETPLARAAHYQSRAAAVLCFGPALGRRG